MPPLDCSNQSRSGSIMDDSSATRLVVAFNFPPFNDGSAVTMAKRIIEWDEEVDVIAADLAAVRQRDASLLELVQPCLRSTEFLNVPVEFAGEASVRAFTDSGLHSFSRKRRQTPYSVTYSRSLWPHSHFLASEIRANEVARSWTAEFSDPMLWQADASPRRSPKIANPGFLAPSLARLSSRQQHYLQEHDSVLDWAQLLPFFLADRLVFTNAQQLEVMLADVPGFLKPDVRGKSEVSPHPTLPRAFYARSGNQSVRPDYCEDDTFHMGYFGTFYPNRGGAEILEAISILPRETRSRLRLDVYSTGARHLLDAARHLGILHLVRALPPLRYLDFLSACEEYDALLVNDVATSPFGVPSPFLPSKYSDYRGSSTPTFAVTMPGSPLDQLDTKWRANIGDVDSIAAEMRRAVEGDRRSAT